MKIKRCRFNRKDGNEAFFYIDKEINIYRQRSIYSQPLKEA